MKYYNFDLASTTQPNDEVLGIYAECAKEYYNPSALYNPANTVAKSVYLARKSILTKLHAPSKSSFIFCPSATIANNLVLSTNIVRKDKEYLVSAGEHSSVHNTVAMLIKQGYHVLFVPLTTSGHIDVSALTNMMTPNVAFVSVIHTSNESGAINDIAAIASIIRSVNPRVIFHSDGVQSINKLPVDLASLDVDYYTISGHKIRTFKGIAGLYVRSLSRQLPYIYGGGQELGMLSGTENVAGIISLDRMILPVYTPTGIRAAIKDELCKLSEVMIFDKGHHSEYILLIAVKGIRAETIVHMMCDRGYLLGTGSACSSSDTTSRILTEMNVPKDYALGELRISFDHRTTMPEAIEMVKSLKECINIYRSNTR